MTRTNDDLWQLGDVSLWVEQDSSIQIKAITDHGDPVELSPDEVRWLDLRDQPERQPCEQP